MSRGKRNKSPVRTAFRPKKVTMELTTKHTHRIFSIQKPMVKFTDLKENPDRIPIGSMERGFVRVFGYRDNPEIGFLSLMDQILTIDQFNYPKLVSLLTKLAWFCGFYGKRAKKYRIKRKNVSNSNSIVRIGKIRR